jgi:hypothetical protein
VWSGLAVALPSLPLPPLVSPPPVGQSLAHGVAASHAWRALAVKGALVAAGFGAGTGTGAVLHARFAQPPAVVASPAVRLPPALAPVPPAVSPAPEAAAPPAPSKPVRHAPTALPTVAAPTTGDSMLADERRLLDRARSALEHNDAAAALEALESHARSHPQGRLQEESDALRVQVLVRQGKLAEAQAAVSAFHAHFPNSMLGPAVDAAIQGR